MTNRNPSRLLTGLCAVVLAVATPASAAAQMKEKVTFNMAWLPQGSIAGPIVAKAKGWFDEADLDVEISRGYGGARTANEIDQGLFDIGYVDPIQVALNRQNGGSLRMVGVINGEWPAGLCYVRKAGANPLELDDLDGLRAGGGSFSPVHQILPVWLEMNDKPRDAVKLLRLEPAVVDASLLEGRIDLAECWRASNRAVLGKLAEQADKEIDWIEYADHGLEAYGSGFATTTRMIEERPEVLRNFLSAAYRGYEFAIEQPEAAADLLVDAHPTLDRKVTLQQIKELKSLIAPEGTLQATFEPEKMEGTLSLITGAFDVPEDAVSAEEIFTNEFAPK